MEKYRGLIFNLLACFMLIPTFFSVAPVRIHGEALRTPLKQNTQEDVSSPLKASFDTPYRHTLPADYSQASQQSKTVWSDTVWRNDVLDAKIVVWTDSKSAHNVRIEVGDFISGDHVLPASQADVRWIKETRGNIGSAQPNAPVIAFPDIIHQDVPADLESGQLKSAWISLTVPENTTPGMYQGTFYVFADELTEPLTLTLNFEVLNAVVPDVKESMTQIEIWQHPYTSARYYDVIPFSDDHRAYLMPQLKEYAAMGGRGVIANIVEEAWNHQSYDGDPSMVKWTKKSDGTFSFDYTDFDRWIGLALEVGILDPANQLGQIKAYSIAPWENIVTYTDETSGSVIRSALTAGSEEWTAAWTAFLEDFMRHTSEKGWFDMTYIAMDERELPVLEHCVNLIESIKNERGETFKISSAMNYSSGSDMQFFDRIDDISVGLSHIDSGSRVMAELARHRKEIGLLTTIYTCTGQYPSAYALSDMSDTAWVMWYSMKQGTDGFLRWSWDGWVEDPLNDISYRTFEPGDPWLIYPAERDSGTAVFYESPRYKILKQGIRDINKAKWLQSLSSEAAAEVSALADSLKRPKAGTNGYGSAIYASKGDRALVEKEVRRMRQGIDRIAETYLKDDAAFITEIKTEWSAAEMRPGTSLTISAESFTPSAVKPVLTWTSKNPDIAEVDQYGTVTAHRSGKTAVTVSGPGEAAAEIQIVVNPTASRSPGAPSKQRKTQQPLIPSPLRQARLRRYRNS